MCYKKVINSIIIKIKWNNLKDSLAWVAIDSMSDTRIKISIGSNFIVSYSSHKRISNIDQEHRGKSLCGFSHTLSCSKITDIFKWCPKSYPKSFIITIF